MNEPETRSAPMDDARPSTDPLLVLGILGIFLMVLFAIGYGLWSAEGHFATDQIEQLFQH